MPLIDLTCENDHPIERLFSPMELAFLEQKPLICEVCGKTMKRKLSAPASVFPGADQWRKKGNG